MTDRLITGDFMPADSLADNEIEFFSLNVPRPGGQHVGMYIAPIVAVHRATGISVTVSDVERSQYATKEKAAARLLTVLGSLRTRPAEPQGLTAEDLGALRNARVCVANHGDGRRGVTHEECVRAIAVLDRLLAAEVRR